MANHRGLAHAGGPVILVVSVVCDLTGKSTWICAGHPWLVGPCGSAAGPNRYREDTLLGCGDPEV